MNYPDKLTYKTTITNDLRLDIIEKSKPNFTFLEIGCDQGYTTLSLSEDFEKLYGYDIDQNRIDLANKNKQNIKNVSFICGTSVDIEDGIYNVILIDADHSYESVKKDLRNVLINNKIQNFSVFFHDYGLKNSGIHKFIHEYFDDNEIIKCGKQDNWNPLGSEIFDCEAVVINFDGYIRKRIINLYE